MYRQTDTYAITRIETIWIRVHPASRVPVDGTLLFMRAMELHVLNVLIDVNQSGLFLVNGLPKVEERWEEFGSKYKVIKRNKYQNDAPDSRSK
ncbi:hypothetical protein EWB00_001904 [Schistosoma japonicum]|uniref:Uncharacterized protein n=1 Tax=Schistosoma japonicum TaxID=6182 RepID=A0A4Z2DE96_SCHJA|nr:hypothetical protein EWB00_001904 [Schistosoma japonicum]